MDDYQDIKELLRPRHAIGASTHLRQRIRNASAQKRSARWLWRTAAAACLALIVGTTMLFNSKSDITPSGSSYCIVYVAGQKANGNEAKAIAESDVAKMEKFMQIVAQQNATEQEKVNQFMQHKYLEK
jgi:anti-sigma-K factor RskA